MRIPVYVVTGFLDSGKTTFLNGLLAGRRWDGLLVLVVQFESGEADFYCESANCKNIAFSKRMLELQPEEIVRQIEEYLKCYRFGEIWVEWNGVEPFSSLHAILTHPSLRHICKMSRVMHIAEAGQFEAIIGKSGGAVLEQIANCDFAVVRNSGAKTPRGASAVKLLRVINPGIQIRDINSYDNLHKGFFGKRRKPLLGFLITGFFMIWLYFFSKPVLEMAGVPVNKIVNIFLGIALQAIPFLLIGVHLSSAIEIFVSKSTIERRFPKTTGMGILAAVAAGFCLPVCDCASIPIFRSLVRKGTPLPAAITFVMVTPVINPVVILSTYYAFNGNMAIVGGRIFLGVVSAVLIGVSFVWRSQKKLVSSGPFDLIPCGCGLYEAPGSAGNFSLNGKIGLFFAHAQAEFFNVGKYLMAGILISSIFQAAGTTAFASVHGSAGLALSTAVMMMTGFALSLCSSSDAVVARSFANQFPLGAVMGFLVFGPMMDIKNFMMLSYGFSRGFIARLSITAFIICFAAVFSFSCAGGW
jgi:uncharacterized membrane protein YraQ (UPF0718 family)